MKISSCQFNDSYFPVLDGVGMTAHNYAHWLSKKDGISSLVAPGVKGYNDNVNYNVYRFKSVLLPGMNPYRIGLPLIDFKFQKKLNKVSFDILHAHCPFISGQLARRLAKKLDVPLVATFHSKYREDFKKIVNNELMVDFLIRMTVDFYHSADYVWVPNRSTGETLRGYGYRGRMEVMRNGTDLEVPDMFTRIKYRKKGLEMTGIDPGDFVMLFVGQHRWEKNVRMIIEAIKILKDKKEHKFRLVFAGEGYAAKEMKTLVKELDLSRRVLFMGLVSDRKKMNYLYACSDLFVFPSVYDNSPLVIQEAAAYDVPSVVVRNSSAAEGITDGINGFVVENDPASLASTLSRVMKSPESVALAGKGARKTLCHSWENVVDDVHIRYMEILKEKGKSFRKQKQSGQIDAAASVH